MYMAKFSWVLGKVLLDDVTEAVLSTCRNHVNVAIAFREQRSAWWQAVRQASWALRAPSFPGTLLLTH